MDRDELTGWLRLSLTPGIGNHLARRLLACFGPPDSVFGQDTTALQQVVNPALAAALGEPPDGLAALVDSTAVCMQLKQLQGI